MSVDKGLYNALCSSQYDFQEDSCPSLSVLWLCACARKHFTYLKTCLMKPLRRVTYCGSVSTFWWSHS